MQLSECSFPLDMKRRAGQNKVMNSTAKFFFVLPFLWSSAAWAQADGAVPSKIAGASAAVAQKSDNKITGIPRLIRDYPVPQVFFRDISGSYQIPSNSSDDYNRFINSLNAALSRKIPITVIIDPKTNTIVDIVDAPKALRSGSLYEDIPDDSANQKMGGSGGGASAGTGAKAATPASAEPPAPPKASGWAD